jgi:4-amino-4-deoxychorismate lyase
MTANGAASVLINGETVDCLSSLDRGLLYGDGVFETLHVEQGSPRFWRRHMTRLRAGCHCLGIDDIDPGVLHAEAGRLLAGVDRCVLKLIITRGTGGRGYGPTGCGAPTRILQRHAAPDYPPALSREGVRVRLCQASLSHNPRLAGIKHLNRLEQVLARSEWDDPDIHEGLMFDANGRLVEGTMSNVFLLLDEGLVTPALSRCGVAGVTRSVVLQLAQRLGLPVQRRDVSADELDRAAEVFLTNSLIGIWPVRRLDARTWPVGAVTRQLQDALAGLEEEGADWVNDIKSGGQND